jgi:hypothetical protein
MGIFSYIFILLGVLFISFGVIMLTKKTVRLHQGMYPRPVDKIKYCRYFGIIDISFGASMILSAVFLYDYIFVQPAVMIAYGTLAIYGEIRYRKKEKKPWQQK